MTHYGYKSIFCRPNILHHVNSAKWQLLSSNYNVTFTQYFQESDKEEAELKLYHLFLFLHDYSETMIEEANKKLLGVSDIRAVIRRRREDKKPTGNHLLIYSFTFLDF